MKENRQKRPTLSHIKTKLLSLKAAANYALSDAEITTMVNERKRLKQAPENFAMKRIELLQRREAAIHAEDYEGIERVGRELAELDQRSGGLGNQKRQPQSQQPLISQGPGSVQRRGKYYRIFMY